MKSEKIERIVDLAATLASRADEFDQVLILYRKKRVEDGDDLTGSMDNDLEIRDALWLVEGFTFWLKAAVMGLLKRDG